MNDARKHFRDSIKVTVNTSRIDFKKNQEVKKNCTDAEEDTYKEERERSKEREERVLEKLFGRDEYSAQNAVFEHLNGGFSPEMVTGKRFEEIIKKVIRLECIYLKINPPAYALYYDNRKDAGYGFYAPKANREDMDNGCSIQTDDDTLYINAAKLIENEEDYRELIDTIVHEIRHKYQNSIFGDLQNNTKVSDQFQNYMMYSASQYDEDKKIFGDYWKNGLEQDARSYAASRTNLYMRFSIKELCHTKEPPIEFAENQILMEAGQMSRKGIRAPGTVSDTFYSEDFRKFKIKQNAKGDFQMQNGTDFSERAQAEAAKIYGDVILSIQSFAENSINHYGERIKEHPYKQLEKVGNVFVDYYNDELPAKIKEAINNWISSDNSFKESLKKQEEDDPESFSAANKVEQGLVDKVNECFKHIEPLKINRAISLPDKDLIQSDKTYMETCLRELVAMKEKWLEEYRKLGEQNSLYATMSSLVSDTFTNTESVYAGAAKDMENVWDEFGTANSAVVEHGVTAGREHSKVRIDIAPHMHSQRKRR